jgi:hypothetical protein
MVIDNDNPYRSPNESGGDAKKPRRARARVAWPPLAIHFLVTLNWGVAVAWMYWEALKPGYPLVGGFPPGMRTYVLVSAWASLLLLPTPIILIWGLISLRKRQPLRIVDLGICAAGLLLSGLQIWLFRLTQYPPIHAI